MQTSFVRSITLDKWTERQVKNMHFGGNQKFTEFLNKFDLAAEEIKPKYSSKAAAFYRKKLVALCNGSEEIDEEEPTFEEGRKNENGEVAEEAKEPAPAAEEEVKIAP